MSRGELEAEVRRVMNSVLGLSAESRASLEGLVDSKVEALLAKMDTLREERIGHVSAGL